MVVDPVMIERAIKQMCKSNDIQSKQRKLEGPTWQKVNKARAYWLSTATRNKYDKYNKKTIAKGSRAFKVCAGAYKWMVKAKDAADAEKVAPAAEVVMKKKFYDKSLGMVCINRFYMPFDNTTGGIVNEWQNYTTYKRQFAVEEMTEAFLGGVFLGL